MVKPFAEITRQEWEQNHRRKRNRAFFPDSTFRAADAAGSSIVNILSIAAKTAYPNWSAYCGSKFALEGLSTAIREELRSRKVRMLNIYPAATDTDIWNAVTGEWPREQMMSAVDVADAVAFAINQPPAVIIENITLSNTSWHAVRAAQRLMAVRIIFSRELESDRGIGASQRRVTFESFLQDHPDCIPAF